MTILVLLNLLVAFDTVDHCPPGLPARGESWRHDVVMVPLLPEVSRC